MINWLNINYEIENQEVDEIYYTLKDEEPELTILTHWITYINDRMKKVDKNKWIKWVQFFSQIIKFYRDQLDINDEFQNFKKDIEVFRNKINKEFQVKQIFPQDWTNIVYTLWILGRFFNKDIYKFLYIAYEASESLELKEDEIRLSFITYLLNLLSYSASDKKGNLKVTAHKITEFFKNLRANSISSDFQRSILNNKGPWKIWNENKRFQSKRLMACLRDFLRMIFFKKLFEQIEAKYNYHKNDKKKWYTLSLNGLELPGDRWNLRFSLPAVLKIGSFNVQRFDNASKMTREIYNSIKIVALKEKIINTSSDFQYYPIDVDFTFWFAKEFCNRNKCNNCPFGPNGFTCNPFDGICNFFESNGLECVEQKFCPIFNKKGKGMCGLVF